MLLNLLMVIKIDMFSGNFYYKTPADSQKV
jgi:hypothetical protein